jgi:periplasmic divalent cation tolerance protein
MNEISMIYITASCEDEAGVIGKKLVEQHLVACVNIFSKVKSIYRWNGELSENYESVIVAKTKTFLVPSVIDEVKRIHTYACPCIVSVPVEDGNPDFFSWIRKETR